MKLTTIILLVACLQISARGLSQGITINKSDVPLETVLQDIEKQSGYQFFYKVSLANKFRSVTVSIKNASLKDAMAEVLKDLPLTYEIVNKTIVIKEKDDPKILEPEIPVPIDVKGRVLNEKGEPVEGTTVTEKGTKNATATNADGFFVLKGVDKDAVLVFSGVNVETYEVKLNGNTDLANINLKTKITVGETVTINTGFQFLKPNEVAGSIDYINNELINRAVSTDILSRLKGISGVLFDKSVGNSLGISIRGRSTIFANAQPLIVVDNFPYDGEIEDINPNDVESITILKDAGAASIWGPRSGNGVIVITTKKGKYNQPVRLEFNVNTSIGSKPDLFYDQQFLNSNDFINLETFLFSKSLYDGDLGSSSYPPLSPVVEILANRRAGLITAGDSAAQINALRGLDIRDDYSKYFYQKAIRQQYAVNLRGGSDKTYYYLSIGYDKNQANIVRDKDERISFNLATTYRPVKNLELSGQIVFTQSTFFNNGITEVFASGRYSNIYPYAQLADEDGNALSIIKDYRSSFAQSPPVSGLLSWQYYPLTEQRLSDNTVKTINNRITAGIKYTLIRGLSAEIKYQYMRGVTQSRTYRSQETYILRNLINKYSTITNNTVTRRNIPLGASLNSGNSNLISQSGRGQINYNGKWNRHIVSAIAGIDISETKTDGNGGTIFGYDDAIGTFIPVNFDSLYTTYPSYSRSTIGGGASITPYALDHFLTYFANISYSYNDRYNISASARSDQSNLFGVSTNQKKNPLWSIGCKWNIDSEKFYHIDWLPSMKFRATYGFNGNVDKSITAQTTARFTTNNLSNAPYAVISAPGNPELRPEKIGIFNVALDFAFKKKTVTGSIEYFHKSGIDMIGFATMAANTGFLSIKGNFSNMVGHGLELRLNWKNIINKNLSWETNLQVNYATDRVTKNEGRTLQMPGRPVNWMYSQRWAGLDANGDPVGYLADTLSKAYSTINTLAASDPAYYIYNGPGTPQCYGSLNNTIYWKGFTLSAIITYKLGYYFRRNSIYYSALFSSSAGHSDFTKRWQKPGDEMHTDVPAMIYPAVSARDQFYSYSEVLVEKGDHIRLQDIRIQYDLNKKQLAKLPFDRLQLYFYANNMGIIWKANNKGIDPDAQTGYPDPKIFSFGIKAGL